MTIRRQWLLILGFIVLLTLLLNTVILFFSVQKDFNEALLEEYDIHVEQISSYLNRAMLQSSNDQIQIVLEGHLTDPIIGLKLYDGNSKLVVAVDSNSSTMMGRGHMMRTSQEVETISIRSGGVVIGYLNVIRENLNSSWFDTNRFSYLIVSNAWKSFVLVLFIAMLIGIFISKYTSKQLKETAEIAQRIDDDNVVDFQKSSILEISKIQESLMSLNQKLKLKTKARKRLIDEITHQSKTPLAIISCHIEGYRDGVIEINDEHLEVVQNQIDNLSRILTHLNHIIESDVKPTPNVEDVDLKALVEKVILGFKTQFQMKSIGLKIIAENIEITTDPYLLSQVLYNVISNAYYHTKEGGCVIVTIGDIITVADDGDGMSSEVLEHIFDPFYKYNSEGDGLGLYICQEIIKQLGGDIEVSSVLGQGTEIRIIL